MAETADGDHKMSCRVGFYTGRDGFLYCDDVRLCELHQQLSPGEGVRGMSPAFVYSRRQVEQNVQQFHQAFKALPVPAMLNFSMKANHNLQVRLPSRWICSCFAGKKESGGQYRKTASLVILSCVPVLPEWSKVCCLRHVCKWYITFAVRGRCAGGQRVCFAV